MDRYSGPSLFHFNDGCNYRGSRCGSQYENDNRFHVNRAWRGGRPSFINRERNSYFLSGAGTRGVTDGDALFTHAGKGGVRTIFGSTDGFAGVISIVDRPLSGIGIPCNGMAQGIVGFTGAA
jgi:hypothetical protein